MKYLICIYITHVTKFVKCFIDQVLHFNITIISCAEDEHKALKKQLKSLTKDFKTIIDQIDLLLINEFHDYKLNFDDVKNCYSLNLNKFIFYQIKIYIILHAIKKILPQYKLLIDQTMIVFAYTNTFIIFIDLSCNHKI